jgi:regulator of sigma E protease
MLTIVAFIFTLGLLVTIHEYGHFIVARMFNVKVLRFSIGFGKPLWQKTFGKDKTELVIAAIPLGGYVKMLDERELEQELEANTSNSEKQQYSEQELNRAFNRLYVGKRIAIVLAGPVANLLLAILLYWVLYMLGIVGLQPNVGKIALNTPAALAGFMEGDRIQKINGHAITSWQEIRWQILNESIKKNSVDIEVNNVNKGIVNYQLDVSSVNHEDQQHDLLDQLGLVADQPVIQAKMGELTAQGAADKAGLKKNDVIIGVNNKTISTWEEFVTQVRGHPQEILTLMVKRNDNTITLKLIPEAVTENDETVGKIGAAVGVEQSELDRYFVVTHYSAFESLIKASQKTWDTSIFSLKMLGRMLTGDVSWKMMSGPVTIASYAGQSAHMGFKIFIGFLALMSISIGVLNLLPIPVLDGGHLMYYMVEFLTGKPISESVMVVGQKIGMLLIGSMMILAFFNDINRFITG